MNHSRMHVCMHPSAQTQIHI